MIPGSRQTDKELIFKAPNHLARTVHLQTCLPSWLQLSNSQSLDFHCLAILQLVCISKVSSSSSPH